MAENNNNQYFVNGPVDFFFIGGASILTYILIELFYTSSRTNEVISIALFLTWFINWPHFSMSTYRLYQSPSNLKQYPFTAYVIPIIVLGGAFLSFSFPVLIAPYFVKLFMLWSPYHFSGQTIGISLIYARRCGIKIGTVERKILTYFVYGTYLLSTLRAEVSRDGYEFYGIKYPGIGVPQWLVTFAEYGMWICFFVFIAAVIYWCIKNKKLMPAIVVLPAITQYIWFVHSIYTPSFQEFVPMFHSLQYLLIAWSIQLKTKLDVKNITPSKRYVLTETLRWGSINFVGGAILFYILPYATAYSGHTLLFSTAIVLSAVQIHHFFVDGVIWKLKHEKVSQPLMMNIRQLTGSKVN